MEFYNKTGILKDLGYVKPKVESDNYRKGDGNLGAIEEILMPNGHGWLPYLPQLERQNEHFETMHCTVYNTLNPIEALAKIKYNEDWDKSERYNGVLAGLTPSGGSPHNVAESIRKFGVIEQSSLPWTSNLNSFWEYSSPRPMTQNYLDEGAKWLRDYEFRHDWVITAGKSVITQSVQQLKDSMVYYFVSTPEAIKDALQYSPLGIAVLAWKFRNGKAYKGRYEVDNHWTVLYDYIEGDCWLVYDSYLNCHIKLEWNYPISFAKRYFINKTNAVKNNAIYIINNFGTMNVKGDKSNAVYFIYNEKKHPYPTAKDFEEISKRVGDKIKVVSQDALDLIPVGQDMIWENIKNIKQFNSIV